VVYKLAICLPGNGRHLDAIYYASVKTKKCVERNDAARLLKKRVQFFVRGA
jgi:hypothetical protein